jgi:Cdc6-like AAA superfamily ATPase
MDLVSATASIIALIDGTYRLVEFLSDFKDGGKERMKLLAEVSNMACTLDSLREKLDQNLPTAGLLTLTKPGGPLDQCTSIVATLTKELASKDAIAGRTVQRLWWSFKKEDVYHTVEQLHRIQATIAQQITLAATKQIQHDSATARRILDDQEEQRIRNWLSPLNFVAQQKAVYGSHCPGTGARFLQSKQFDTWRRSSKSILWCRGAPGTGKTYLSSIIVHELQKTSQAKGDIVLIAYCRYNDPECQDLANIVGDLLKQCLKGRPTPDSLAELFRTHCSTDTRPTYETLLSILFDQLQSYRRCYIVIDALDELANPTARSLLVASLRAFQANSIVGDNWNGSRRQPPQTTITPSVRAASHLVILSRGLEDIEAAMAPMHCCDCCMVRLSPPCGHCGDCLLSYLSSDYLYNCQSCALPYGAFSGGYDVCQGCYDAGARCPEETHPKMVRRVNNILFDISADEEDLQQYLQWRVETDPPLKALLKKQNGLQSRVFDSVVRSSGPMFVIRTISS